MKTYEEIYSVVEKALENDLTYKLAEAFTEKTESKEVKQVLAEQLEQAVYGVDDFDLSVGQYLLVSLEQQGKSRNAGYYDSEEEAEKDQFYWFDELDLWIKLPYPNN